MPKTFTEKDKQILGIIKTAALRYPFADFSALCKIPDERVRYMAANQTLSDELSEEYGLDPMRLPEFVVARWMATKHIAERLAECGFSGHSSAKTVADLIGMDKTLLSHYLTGKRPFSAIGSLPALSYGVLHESCHMTMHGEEGRICLPHIYSLIATEMLTMPQERIDNLLSHAKRKKAKFYADADVYEEYLSHRPIMDVVRERLEEYARESGRPITSMFKRPGVEYPDHMKFPLYKLFTVAEDNTDKIKYTVNLPTLQWFSFATGQAIDYFLCENYCAFCPVYYDTGKDLRQLTDRNILFFLGVCTALPQDERSELISLAFTEILKNEFEGTKRKAIQYGKSKNLPYSAFGLWIDEKKRDGLFNRKAYKDDL